MDGNYLVIVDKNHVGVWDQDDMAVSENLGVDLGQYLEQIRDGLLSKSMAFDEDLGIYKQK